MKRYAVLTLLLVSALLFPTLVGASGDTLPGPGFWTGEQIQNIGASNATIASTAYDSTSAATYSASAGPISPGASVTFLPADFAGMPAGFQGSAVVSSDQPIKAIVNLTNRQVGSYGTTGGVAGGQYQGVDGAAAATTVRFPIVKRAFGGAPNIKTTTFFVQNAGSAAATVTISYNCSGTPYSQTSTSINPGQMVVLSPSAAGVPPATTCSATVTSAQPIAGTAVEHYDVESVATLVQTTRGFTPADYNTTIYAPIFKEQFPVHATQSRTGGAQVQNVSGGSITVTGTFYGSGGTCPAGNNYTQTSPSIADGASFTFLHPTGMPAGCVASAKFVGTGNIVGIVNESYLNPAPAPGTQSSTAYNMISGGLATTKLVAPLYKEQFGGKTSGLQVQNIGGSSATIHVDFKVGATTYTTVNFTVASGASQNFYLVSGQSIWVGSPLPASSAAGVTVISDQPILGVVAEQTYTVAVPNCYSQVPNQCFDRQNYEAFPVAP